MNYKPGDLVVYVRAPTDKMCVFEPGSILEVLNDLNGYQEENAREGYPPTLRVRLRFGATRMDWAEQLTAVYIFPSHVKPFDKDNP